MKIIIKDHLKNDAALFHSEGIIISDMIKLGLRKHDEITVSFEGIEYCSTHFLSAAIGILYIECGMEEIKRLDIIDMSDSIKKRFEKVVLNVLRSKIKADYEKTLKRSFWDRHFYKILILVFLLGIVIKNWQGISISF